MKRKLFLGGGHRGGEAFSRAALQNPDAYNEVIVADPKADGRAFRLAQEWREAGVKAEGLQEHCERVIREVEVDSIMLSIDAVAPMAAVLNESTLPGQWQLLARGVGFSAPVIAISGTVIKGDAESRAASVWLIGELASFVEPASSIGIRSNPSNSVLLESMRERVSALSATRVRQLGREPEDISGGVLNLVWDKIYPMLVQEKPRSWLDTKEAVVGAELPVALKDKDYAVASVGERNVDFFVISSLRGKRFIVLHLPLVHTLPTNEEIGRFRRFKKEILTASGLAKEVMTSIPAAAMVTD